MVCPRNSKRLGGNVCFRRCGSEETIPKNCRREGEGIDYRRRSQRGWTKRGIEKNRSQYDIDIEGRDSEIDIDIERKSRKSDIYGDLRQNLTSRANPLATDIALRRLELLLFHSIERLKELNPKFKEKIDKMNAQNEGSQPQPMVVPTITLDLNQLLVVQCPLPSQPGAPCFNGKEVTRFIRSWERFVEKYRISAEKMVRELIDYCDDSVLHQQKAPFLA